MKLAFWIDNPVNHNPPESKVWFYLVIRTGILISVEEHNLYAGGLIGDEDTDLHDLFLQRVAHHGGDVGAAQKLLDENVTYRNIHLEQGEFD